MTDKPDFETLRAKRNLAVEEMHKNLAEEWGMPLQFLRSNFNANACYCACPEGPCEHTWDGPEWESADGLCSSVACSRCGRSAMSHDLRTGP